MDIIQKYVEPQDEQELSLVYLAKPIYGGWVTFTVHLAKQFNYRLYKVGKRTEKKVRNYGYGIDYQNVSLEDLLKLPNLLISTNLLKFETGQHIFISSGLRILKSAIFSSSISMLIPRHFLSLYNINVFEYFFGW